MSLSKVILVPLIAMVMCVNAFAAGEPAGNSETGNAAETDYVSEDFDACTLSTPEETWAFWDQILSDEDKDFIRTSAFDDLILFHRGWGMGIRNDMCLWKGGALITWFEARGVSHPDDMSHRLIQLYWAHLNGCHADADAFVQNIDIDSDEHLGCE